MESASRSRVLLRLPILLAGLLLLARTLPAADAPPGVVLDWDFEEGRTNAPLNFIMDQSGRNNHGVTFLGNPALGDTPLDPVGGRLGLSVRGSGIFGSCVLAAESASLNLGRGQAFTVEAIFRLVGDNGSANRTLVQRSDPNTLVWSYGLYYDGDRQQANFGVAGADGRSVLVYADVPNDGQFHRLAGVFDRGQVSLYVDGVLRTNLATTIQPDTRPKRGVAVGAIFNGGYYFNGEIARVRLTSQALGPADQLGSTVPRFEGIPVTWWEQWFGANWATDSRARAEADADADGSGNRTEYWAQTNPLDPDSGFLRTISLTPRLEWRTVVGGVYRVERRLSLDSTNRIVVAPELTATSTNLVFYDEGSPHPLSFYDIRRLR